MRLERCGSNPFLNVSIMQLQERRGNEGINSNVSVVLRSYGYSYSARGLAMINACIPLFSQSSRRIEPERSNTKLSTTDLSSIRRPK